MTVTVKWRDIRYNFVFWYRRKRKINISCSVRDVYHFGKRSERRRISTYTHTHIHTQKEGSGKEKYTAERKQKRHEITDIACRYPPWHTVCTAFREFSHPVHCAKRYTVVSSILLNYLRKSQYEVRHRLLLDLYSFTPGWYLWKHEKRNQKRDIYIYYQYCLSISLLINCYTQFLTCFRGVSCLGSKIHINLRIQSNFLNLFLINDRYILRFSFWLKLIKTNLRKILDYNIIRYELSIYIYIVLYSAINRGKKRTWRAICKI